jgi:DNA-binding MarR family transcriptional regulator
VTENSDDEFREATAFGDFVFLLFEEMTEIRERVLSAADILGDTRDSDIQLLLEIGRRNLSGTGPSAHELGVAWNWSDKTLSNDLDRLERAGYIERRQSEQDKRIKTCWITDSGRELVTAVVEAARAELRSRGRHRRFQP